MKPEIFKILRNMDIIQQENKLMNTMVKLHLQVYLPIELFSKIKIIYTQSRHVSMRGSVVV